MLPHNKRDFVRELSKEEDILVGMYHSTICSKGENKKKIIYDIVQRIIGVSLIQDTCMVCRPLQPHISKSPHSSIRNILDKGDHLSYYSRIAL